jgi:uncharacterized protein
LKKETKKIEEVKDPDEILKNIPRSKWARPIFDRERERGNVTYYIFPTHICNLRCDYCYYHEMGAYKLPKMTDKTIHDTIEFIDKWEVAKNITIHFFGGEPTAAWDVIEKIVNLAKAKENWTVVTNMEGGDKECSGGMCTTHMGGQKKEGEKRITFSMTTNGTLLDDDKLNFIKQNFKSDHPFLLSIDGPEHIHNKHRVKTDGSGSFKDIPLVDIFTRWKPEILEIRPTYTKDMLPHDLLKSYKWLYEIGFRKIPVEFDYEDKWNQKELGKLYNTVISLNSFWYETVKKGDATGIPKSVMEPESVFFKGFHGTTGETLCGVGRNSMGIDSMGGVWACQRWAGYTGENVPEEYILGTVDAGIDLDKLYHIQNLSRNKMIKPKEMNCDICPVKSLCVGGCNAMLWSKKGSRFQLDQDWCRVKQTIFHASVAWFMSSGYYNEMIKPKLMKQQPAYDIRTKLQRENDEKRKKQGGGRGNINNNRGIVRCTTCQNCFTSQGGRGGRR